jgi:hypothetical protein
MDDATVATTKSSASAKGLPKCVCSWKNCRTYQKAYRSVGHPVLDGVVKVKFIKGDTASIPLKASVDRTLKVSKDKRQDWMPAKGEEILRYNIARHHFTEAHILKYMKNPKSYKWTSLFSAGEAKKYLFKLDPKETMSLGDAEVYYVQCPNVAKDFVKEQFLKMKAAMEENQRREEEKKRAAAQQQGGLDTYLNHGGREGTQHSARSSLPSITDDPTIASSKSTQLLKLQEEENERLRKELESCQSQLSYLNEIVRQLQEDANADNMSVYSRKSKGRGSRKQGRFPDEILLDDDESEWDGGNDDDQDWSEGIDEDDTINDDESSAFLGPAMMKKNLAASTSNAGGGGGATRRNSLSSRQSRASLVSASQTVKSLPREIELAEVEANGSGSEDSGLKDDFDEMSYVSRGSRVSRNTRDRRGGDSRDGDARSVNSRQSRRGDKNRRRRQQKTLNNQNANNKSASSGMDAGSDDKKSVSWDGSDVEVYEVKQQVIVDPYGEKGTYAGTLSKGTGMPHGKGRLEYAAGRWYEGEWKHGRWTGEGRLSNGDGDLYEGELRNDHKHGKGTMRFADGRVFVGEYVNGQMTEGKMIYQDGSTYEGGWADGMRHGRGKCVFTDESIYEGEFREGEFHGHGKMTWSDGGWYEGEWWNGEMHGQGKEVRPNGSMRHDGAWSKGQPMRKRK